MGPEGKDSSRAHLGCERGTRTSHPEVAVAGNHFGRDTHLPRPNNNNVHVKLPATHSALRRVFSISTVTGTAIGRGRTSAARVLAYDTRERARLRLRVPFVADSSGVGFKLPKGCCSIFPAVYSDPSARGAEGKGCGASARPVTKGALAETAKRPCSKTKPARAACAAAASRLITHATRLQCRLRCSRCW